MLVVAMRCGVLMMTVSMPMPMMMVALRLRDLLRRMSAMIVQKTMPAPHDDCHERITRSKEVSQGRPKALHIPAAKEGRVLRDHSS